MATANADILRSEEGQRPCFLFKGCKSPYCMNFWLHKAYACVKHAVNNFDEKCILQILINDSSTVRGATQQPSYYRERAVRSAMMTDDDENKRLMLIFFGLKLSGKSTALTRTCYWPRGPDFCSFKFCL
jgi:hypothetical protein